jgi:hypothetical protein
MTYNENTKIAHYKWRETHKEQYKSYVNKGAKKYYHNHKEEASEKSLKRYYLNKELQTFRNILL